MIGIATDATYLRSVINALLKNPKHSFLKHCLCGRVYVPCIDHPSFITCHFETETYMPKIGNTIMNNEL
jgi:hypothetical protein